MRQPTVLDVIAYDSTDREVADIVAFQNNMLDKWGGRVRFSVGYSEASGEEMVIAADQVITDPDDWAEQYVANNRQYPAVWSGNPIEPYREGIFYIDDVEPSFQGFTQRRYWNGWSMPSFTKEVGMQIVETCSDLLHPAKYDEETDTFLFCMDGARGFDDSENVDSFTGSDILVNGETTHVYAIGAGCWTWCEADLESNPDD